MDIPHNAYRAFPGMTPEEADFLEQGTSGLSEDQRNQFFRIYEVKRKNPQNILLLTVVGTMGIAGLQRFATGEIILGFLYLFTFGFFWVGTILDLINYKKITNGHNRQMAFESFEMVKQGY